MRSETIAIHSGYDVEPTTKAVAVPIYQTVAYAFDSADHGAALFNLEAEGFRYSRISNPTNAVREQRTGRAVLRDGQCQQSGQQPRVGAAALRHDAHAVRPHPAEPGRQRPV